MSVTDTTKQTFLGYDLWARGYDELDNPLLYMVDLAWRASPEGLEGKRVLELGCGTGRNIPRVLVAAGAVSYTGVDGSAGMLEKARGRAAGDGRVRLMEGDIQERLPVEAGAFDFVLISLVLEHLAEVGRVMGEVARALAPGGILRVFELHAESSRAGVGAHFLHEGQDIRLPTHAHEAGEFRAALKGAGLEVLRTTDWFAPSSGIAKCPKLAKYPNAFMFELVATVKHIGV